MRKLFCMRGLGSAWARLGVQPLARSASPLTCLVLLCFLTACPATTGSLPPPGCTLLVVGDASELKEVKLLVESLPGEQRLGDVQPILQELEGPFSIQPSHNPAVAEFVACLGEMQCPTSSLAPRCQEASAGVGRQVRCF